MKQFFWKVRVKHIFLGRNSYFCTIAFFFFFHQAMPLNRSLTVCLEAASLHVFFRLSKDLCEYHKYLHY